jgi:hypothetical protein
MLKCHLHAKDDVRSILLDLFRIPFFNLVVKNEIKTPAPPPQFAIHQTDATSVLIEAIVSTDKPVLFEDVFDVYSKRETINDDEWIKVCTF